MKSVFIVNTGANESSGEVIVKSAISCCCISSRGVGHRGGKRNVFQGRLNVEADTRRADAQVGERDAAVDDIELAQLPRTSPRSAFVVAAAGVAAGAGVGVAAPPVVLLPAFMNERNVCPIVIVMPVSVAAAISLRCSRPAGVNSIWSESTEANGASGANAGARRTSQI